MLAQKICGITLIVMIRPFYGASVSSFMRIITLREQFHAEEAITIGVRLGILRFVVYPKDVGADKLRARRSAMQ